MSRRQRSAVRSGRAALSLTLLAVLFGVLPSVRAEEPLAGLRAALEAKNAEEVLLGSLDLEPLPEGAAPILAAAAHLANTAADPLLSMQLCQRALKVAPREVEALLACIEAARSLDQFDPALEWTRTLRKAHPRDPRGLLWEARLAEAEGEWKRAQAAAGKLEAHPKATAEARTEARGIGERAELRAAEASAVRTKVAALEAALEKARTERARLGSAPSPRSVAARSPSTGVTIYTTRWCGYCKKAKRWMRSRGVRFVERDIEKDPAAALDLAARAAEAKVRLGGVPVFDVEGDLMGGWSEKGLERLLKRHGLL